MEAIESQGHNILVLKNISSVSVFKIQLLLLFWTRSLQSTQHSILKQPNGNLAPEKELAIFS